MTKRRVYNRVYSPEIWEQVNPTSKEVFDDFILYMRENKRCQSTINQYFCDLRGFLCYLYSSYNNRFVLELTRKDIRRYALSLIDERQVSNSRRNTLMSSLKSMLDFAELSDDWEYEINAARLIKGLQKESVKPIIFVPDSAVMYLYDELMRREQFQHATLLMLAYESAGRRAELAQVTKYSFTDPSRNNTNEVIGKRRKVFSLVYFDLTRKAALAWLDQRGKDDIADLFVAGYRDKRHEALPIDVHRMFEDMRGIDFLPGDQEGDFAAHSMRHTALANYKDGTHHVCRDLGRPGFTLEQLQILAHHDSIETTQSYLPDMSRKELETMFDISIA